MEGKTDENIQKFLKSLPARVNQSDYEKITLFKVKGCEKCGNIGYKGRIAVFEFLQINEEMEQLIYEKATEVNIKELAGKQGMVTMQQDGILKALTGVTDFDEVARATGAIVW